MQHIAAPAGNPTPGFASADTGAGCCRDRSESAPFAQGLCERQCEGKTPYLALLGPRRLDDWIFARFDDGEILPNRDYALTALRAYRDGDLEDSVREPFAAAVVEHATAAIEGGQASWDQGAALFAVRGAQPEFWEVVRGGRVRVDDRGNTIWETDANARAQLREDQGRAEGLWRRSLRS